METYSYLVLIGKRESIANVALASIESLEAQNVDKINYLALGSKCSMCPIFDVLKGLELEKDVYINDSKQEEEEASGITVLSGGDCEVNIVVLYENAGHAIVMYTQILSLRIDL
ncbi:hypothetical protein VNO77_04196 [Canavalia gladiata]|uniref:Uncharacterized protein n=1 Tax=Canavalia gladiata TaxID=3824 RepID=A0AAN9MY56_CANGL